MKILRDIWLVFHRAMSQTLRNPAFVIIGMSQPLLYLALFGPLVGKLTSGPGFPPGDGLDIFVPGLIIMTGLLGGLFVGFGLIAEIRFGVIERLRGTPVSRLALLLGRALRDVVVALVQALIIVVVSIPFGLSADPLGLLVLFGLMVLLILTMVSFSYAVALKLRSEGALGGLVNTIMLPSILLSGMLLPLTLAPRWLNDIANVNPLSYAVDASRVLLRGDIANRSVLEALLYVGALAVLTIGVTVRTFSTSNS